MSQHDNACFFWWLPVDAEVTRRAQTPTHGATVGLLSLQGMKVSCTHFQCSAGAFSYLRDHFSHNFSVDMSHQILNLNINLMLVRYPAANTQTARNM